jgi:cobalt-zinc-cadmium efflux system protein
VKASGTKEGAAVAHVHSAGEERSGGRLVAGIAINVGIFAVQIIGGVLSGSLALITDALHNITDVASLGLSLVALRVARRPADERYTFAYRRAEVLAAAVNAALLLVIALYVGYEAVLRIANPSPVGGDLMMAAAAFGAVANALAAWLVHTRDGNLNMRSAMLHLVSDSVASIGVLLAGLAIRLWSVYLIDPIVSLAIAVWMFYESSKLVARAFRILMNGVPEDIELAKIRETVLAIDGVTDIHDLRVWALSSSDIVASAHLVLDREGIGEATQVVSRVKDVLHETFGVEHATIETECAGGGCASCAIRESGAKE